ncbi:hypothetical protein BC628DRAFT_271249 [Trametes gibbosa]|nr:hypothetical protein BC628DRAFT_271249 [Trametes gibbosa]
MSPCYYYSRAGRIQPDRAQQVRAMLCLCSPGNHRCVQTGIDGRLPCPHDTVRSDILNSIWLSGAPCSACGLSSVPVVYVSVLVALPNWSDRLFHLGLCSGGIITETQRYLDARPDIPHQGYVTRNTRSGSPLQPFSCAPRFLPSSASGLGLRAGGTRQMECFPKFSHAPVLQQFSTSKPIFYALITRCCNARYASFEQARQAPSGSILEQCSSNPSALKPTSRTRVSRPHGVRASGSESTSLHSVIVDAMPRSSCLRREV